MYTASFIGKKHIKKNMPCQDACASVITKSGLEILAVADGVSSSRFSEVAARKAVDAVCDFWNRTDAFYTDSGSMNALMRTCFNYALRMSKSDDPDIKVPYGYETTLQTVVYVPGEKYCIMYVGDGGIYARKRDGKFSLLTGAMREEDGCVVPLSDGPSRWNYTEITAGDIEQIAVVTDGVNDVTQKYGTELITTLSEACGKKYSDALKKILKDEPFDSIDDDITVCFTEKKADKPTTVPDKEPIVPVLITKKKAKKKSPLPALLIVLAIFAIAAIVIVMSLLKKLKGKDTSEVPPAQDRPAAADELQNTDSTDDDEVEETEQNEEGGLNEENTRPFVLNPYFFITEETPEPDPTPTTSPSEETSSEYEPKLPDEQDAEDTIIESPQLKDPGGSNAEDGLQSL